MYGPYTTEELVGRSLRDRRDDVVIATKFGTIRHTAGDAMGLDGSPENVRLSVEGSPRRWGTDYIDLDYQHRMDPSVPVKDTMGALAELVHEGKIRHIGLSEAAPATIRRVYAVHPVTALQTEYSLWSRNPEQEILPLLRELGIGFVPYSPLGRGFPTGTIRSVDQLDESDFRRNNPRFTGENLQANIRIVEQVDDVARQLDTAPGQVALAWLLAQGTDIAPIPGTKQVRYLDENIASDNLVLNPTHLERLDAVTAPVGDRYEDMSGIDR